jgi:hypothetical protein
VVLDCSIRGMRALVHRIGSLADLSDHRERRRRI